MLHERRHARFLEQHVDERFLRREVLVDELHHDELFKPSRPTLDG
jgi:hypothetical protein